MARTSITGPLLDYVAIDETYLPTPQCARAWGVLARAGKKGFTLIELLVVIAIISILIALIFPVFGSIMENSREQNTMANMHTISSGLALYKLDNHFYPPVLFGYAMPDGAGGYVPMSAEAGQPNASQYLVGLYPQYVHDWKSFTSADNPSDDGKEVTPAVNVNAFPGATAADPRALAVSATPPVFYVSDAFDVSPQLTGINQISKTSPPVYVPRYQTSWTSYPQGPAPSPFYPPAAGSCDTTSSTTCDPDYSRQLRWELPPANTYVTSTTYHVGNANKVLVLFESGTVKKVDVGNGAWTAFSPATNYAACEASYNDGSGDITPVANAAGRPDANAQFWRYTSAQ